jgi:large subunit ribosomal protein L10
MNRDQKAVVIDEIAANIQESEAIFAVDFRGITVPQAAELRGKLREVDASFRVVKNSLTERAADLAGAASLKGMLAGPTALTFVRGDAAMAAKAIADYARLTQKLAFKGGVMDGQALTGEQVTAISRLLSRQALYGQLVGLVASPLSGLVRTLNALIGGLAVALGGVLEKKESGEIPAGDPPVAAPAPVEADAPVEQIPTEVAEEPVPTVAETSQAAPPTPDSGDEVAGAPAAQTDEAQAEEVPAAEASATASPSHKEND